MTALTIHIDEAVEARLRERAESKGLSLESEVEAIVEYAVLPPPENGAHLYDRIRHLVKRYGGLPDDFQLPERERLEDPPDFR